VRNIITALSVMLLSGSASAMSVTYTDVSHASYAYVPGQDGIFSIDFTAEFGPSTSPFWNLPNSVTPSTRVEGGICGILFTQCVYDLTRLTSTAGITWFSGCGFSVDQNCDLMGGVSFNSQMFDGYHLPGFPNSLVTFLFDVPVYGNSRPFISSTVTFTGPDPVPLPTAFWLFASGLVSLAWLKRRVRT
jgi:hypothetical protein